MAWTWTGYDHDAVHRFKDEKFWQTGRNKAEDRFWQTQIHGENLDRRGTMSSISIGSRASPFRSGHTDSSGRHVHGFKYEPRERSNSVMSTLSSRMRQFGPSRDYPYALPGEFSEEEEEEEEEEKEEVKEEKEEIRKEEPKENEKKEEKKKEDDDKDDTASVSCSCSEKVEKEREKIEVKEKKKDEEQKQDVDVKETTEIKEWNLKRNPMKTMIAAKIDRGNHISSRFY